VSTPTALTFSYAQGGSQPPPQTLAISSSGSALSFTAAASTTSGGSRLSVSPGSGTTPANLSVAVNPAGLAAGTYSGSITITNSGASPLSAGVTLNVAQSASTFTFADNFAPGPSPLWNNYSGNWAASGGHYYAQAPSDNPLTFSGLPFDLTDYTLTVTVNAVWDGGVWLRSNADSPQYGDSIVLIIGGQGYGQGLRGGNAGTSVYFATPSGQFVNGVNGVLTPGGTYTFTVTVQGDTYSVYINGSKTPVTTLVLVDSTFSHGQVGFYDDQPNTPGGGSGTPTTFSNSKPLSRILRAACPLQHPQFQRVITRVSRS
jgi:hypothetical protein